MNTSIYIAKRYLFAKKSTYTINIISGISMLAIFIGSMALIIILSVYNGFEHLILSLYNNSTPELKIEAKIGKTFDPSSNYFNSLRKRLEVFSFTEVLEAKALIRYSGSQFIGTVKGVSDNFLKNTALNDAVKSGSFTLERDNQYFAVIGTTIQASLGVSLQSLIPLEIYMPRKQIRNAISLANEFVVKYIYPSGIFSMQQDLNANMFVPIEWARDILDEPQKVSSLEINFKQSANIHLIQKEIEHDIGEHFLIKNRQQQDTLLYKMLHSERWAIVLILSFILLIAICNIIGSLAMLIIDKRKDVSTLFILGASQQLIQHIFFFEGLLITFIGCIGGMFFGLLLCMLQQQYPFIKMGSTLTDTYPVVLKLKDFVLVFLVVMFIALVTSRLSAQLSTRNRSQADLRGGKNYLLISTFCKCAHCTKLCYTLTNQLIDIFFLKCC